MLSVKYVPRVIVAVVVTLAGLTGLFSLKTYATSVSEKLGHVVAFGGGLLLAYIVYTLAHWVRRAR
jgi:glucose-6-phosphate-specific signal transduction histidine kinase